MCREVSKEILEFECDLKFNFDVLEGQEIPYKYCVCGTNCDNKFEYLHGAPPQHNGGYRNRCLRANNKTGQGKM